MRAAFDRMAAGESEEEVMRDFGYERRANLSTELGEWRPIATAPRDGTHIYVGNFNNNEPGYGWYDGKWIYAQTVAHWFENGFYPSCCEKDCDLPISVTHWMPLPKPPNELSSPAAEGSPSGARG
jgi:hypothetical protein